MQRKNIIVAFTALTLVAASSILSAGPLNPPAGPITSTYKTLTEVEPRTAIDATNTPGDADSLFKITQPGSYYLTGNITGVVGKYGIEITAGGVTLDLNGFDLVGVAGSLDGVATTVADLANITVRNGSVRGWGDEGIDLAAFSARNSTVNDVRASGNTGNGVQVGGGTSVTGCTAYQNAVGIVTSTGCLVTGCTANENTINGITIGAATTISGCTCYGNMAYGIQLGSGCTAIGCTVFFNTAIGINAPDNCTITNCTARSNGTDGIRVRSSCLVLANTCGSNGDNGDGANIHALITANRIEGNICTTADRGIDVDAAGNIIIRNTCSGNTTNWDVVAGNAILVINATNLPTAAVTGDSGGANPGSDNPYANFSY